MINKYIKIYMFLCVLLSDFMLFAQDPGTDFEDEEGGTDGSVEDEAPINSKLIWLALLGILFSYHYFKSMHNAKQKE